MRWRWFVLAAMLPLFLGCEGASGDPQAPERPDAPACADRLECGPRVGDWLAVRVVDHDSRDEQLAVVVTVVDHQRATPEEQGRWLVRTAVRYDDREWQSDGWAVFPQDDQHSEGRVLVSLEDNPPGAPSYYWLRPDLSALEVVIPLDGDDSANITFAFSSPALTEEFPQDTVFSVYLPVRDGYYSSHADMELPAQREHANGAWTHFGPLLPLYPPQDGAPARVSVDLTRTLVRE